MPDDSTVSAKDLVDELKKKHAAKSYKKMVIYLEACESGSMFEGLLPDDINIYATTASNATEDSYAFYCPSWQPSKPSDYDTCLGDLYSISWLEDSDKNDMTSETLKQQYETVRRRTLTSSQYARSHVMQYGDRKMNNGLLVTYLGANVAANVNDNYNLTGNANAYSSEPFITLTRLVSQRDARLLYLWNKLEKAPDGSKEKLKAQKELDVELAHREHIDNSIHLIGDIFLGEEKNTTMMVHVRPTGQPLVDDWDCFKTLIKTYEIHCGTLSTYGRKYSRSFANMCNDGISEKQMAAAASRACPKEIHAS